MMMMMMMMIVFFIIIVIGITAVSYEYNKYFVVIVIKYSKAYIKQK